MHSQTSKGDRSIASGFPRFLGLSFVILCSFVSISIILINFVHRCLGKQFVALDF